MPPPRTAVPAGRPPAARNAGKFSRLDDTPGKESIATGTRAKGARGLKMKPEPFRRPMWDMLLSVLSMHTGSFVDLGIGDGGDDQEQLQRLSDQISLAAGLRLSFTCAP